MNCQDKDLRKLLHEIGVIHNSCRTPSKNYEFERIIKQQEHIEMLLNGIIAYLDIEVASNPAVLFRKKDEGHKET